MLIIILMLILTAEKWDFGRIYLKIECLSWLTSSVSSAEIEEKLARHIHKTYFFTRKLTQNISFAFSSVLLMHISYLEIINLYRKNIEVIR